MSLEVLKAAIKSSHDAARQQAKAAKRAKRAKRKAAREKRRVGPTLATLPTEILDIVCSHLYTPSIAGHDQGTTVKDLQYASLICRAFREPAQQWLFRHITVPLHTSDSNKIGPLVDRLCAMSGKAFRVRHLTIVPGECHSSPIRRILVPTLRAFLASPRVIIETLALNFWDGHFDNSLIDYPDRLHRVNQAFGNLRVSPVVREHPPHSGHPAPLAHVQAGDVCTVEDEDEGDEDRNEDRMQILEPTAGLDSLTFVSPCTQWSPMVRFSIALLQNVRRLEIDTLNIVDFAHIVRRNPGTLLKVAEIKVFSHTSATAATLRDIQIEGGFDEHTRPWLDLGYLLSMCKNLQKADLIIPCCYEDSAAFSFHNFPESLLSVSLRFDTCRYLPLPEWWDLMDNIEDFIRRSRRLQIFTLHLATSAWDESLRKYGDHGTAGDWWNLLDEGREEILELEAREACPEAFRRYPYEPLSELDDDFDLDLTDSSFQQWYRARAQRLFLEQVVEETICQSDELARILSSRKIPYTIIVPDFSINNYDPKEWQQGSERKPGQKSLRDFYPGVSNAAHRDRVKLPGEDLQDGIVAA